MREESHVHRHGNHLLDREQPVGKQLRPCDVGVSRRIEEFNDLGIAHQREIARLTRHQFWKPFWNRNALFAPIETPKRRDGAGQKERQAAESDGISLSSTSNCGSI